MCIVGLRMGVLWLCIVMGMGMGGRRWWWRGSGLRGGGGGVEGVGEGGGRGKGWKGTETGAFVGSGTSG